MENKISIGIIDDDIAITKNLIKLISDYPDLTISWTAGSVSDGEKKIKELSPKILFIDIELPDGNGIDFIKKNATKLSGSYIIMFTAFYDKHNDEAFLHNENDYLLKPVLPNELDKVIQRYRHHTQNIRISEIPQRSTTPEMHDNDNTFAAITPMNEIRVIRPQEVGYFRYSSQRRVWEIALADRTFVQLRKGTAADLILSYNKMFVQTHQSYIINLQYLTLVSNGKCILFPPFNEDDILIGRTFRNKLMKAFTSI